MTPVTFTRNHEVSQQSLVNVLNARQRVKEMEKALETEKALLRAAEDQVVAALDEGTHVANGQRTASVKTTTRRTVAWKQEFVTRLGKPLADKLTAEVEPTVYKKLEIA